MTTLVERMKVRVTFTEDLLGSWPTSPDLLTRFVSSKAPAPWLQAEEEDTVPDRPQGASYTGFPHDSKGLFLYNYHVKGFIKEAGNALKNAVGIKNLRHKIDNYVFVQPRRIYLTRDGKTITGPDDVLERPLRGMTPQGPRISLIGSERVKTPVTIEFTVEVLKNKEVTLKLIRELLDYGAYKGIGQWRNGGWGSFTWEELN